MAKSTTPKKKKIKSSTTTKIKKELKKKAEPKPAVKDKTISFGCTLLDLMIGGGEIMGAPAGKIINIVGDKSAGKTFLATEAIAATHHKYGNKFDWNYDDGEDGYTFDTKKLYGFDIMNKDTLKSKQIEYFDTNTRKFLKTKLKKGQIGLYVLDSLDGLSDEEKKERAEKRFKQAEAGKAVKDEGTYGTASAKFLSSEFFKDKTGEFANHKASLFIISQVREKINPLPFEKKLKRSGGKAMDFYAWAVIWLATVFKIKKKDRAVGVLVKATLDKSKTPRPFRSCKFIFYFDYGVDDIGTSLNYLYDVWGMQGLNKNSKAIPWDGGKERTVKNIKDFLEREDVLSKYRKIKKRDTGKDTITIDHSIEWIQSKEELKIKFDKEFGKLYEYEELCAKIDGDPKLQERLRNMVIYKWEQEEAEIATPRKRKYS